MTSPTRFWTPIYALPLAALFLVGSSSSLADGTIFVEEPA